MLSRRLGVTLRELSFADILVLHFVVDQEKLLVWPIDILVPHIDSIDAPLSKTA